MHGTIREDATDGTVADSGAIQGDQGTADNPASRGPGFSVEFWTWYDEYAVPRLESWRAEGLNHEGIYKTRALTFRKMFEYLDTYDRPVAIIETGCANDLENWGGNGCSTILFDKYCQTHPGSLFMSVDTSWQSVEMCRKAVAAEKTFIDCGDSVEFLRKAATRGNKFDLVYLDASDMMWLSPLLTQKHHLEELMAVLPAIDEDTLVCVDDSPSLYEFGRVDVTGKGHLVAKYAAEVGAHQVFGSYQAGWTQMNTKKPQQTNLKTLLKQAGEYANSGRINDADNIYRKIFFITENPANQSQCIARGEAAFFFAKMAMAAGLMGTALDWYETAIKYDPGFVGYRLEMCNRVLKPLKHWQAARNEAFVATRIAPDNVHAWTQLGEYEHELGKMKEAEAAYRRAVELAPDHSGPRILLISFLTDKPDYAEMDRLAKEVIAIDPKAKGDALETLAFIAYRNNEHEEAIRLYDEALACGVTQEPTLRWNKSMALHAIGHYKEGWAEHAWREHERTQMALYVPFNRFKSPRWRGEPPAIDDGHGAPRRTRLHIHCEAGYGDNICCVRYLPILAERGYDVRYEAYENMVPLMRRSFPNVKITQQALDYPGALGVEPFDYHTPIGELPHMLGTDIDTVPWSGPYLVPDPELVEHYRVATDALGLKGTMKVGVCWSAGIRVGMWISNYGRRKSMHFRDLEKVFFPGAKDDDLLWLPRYFSLQVGPEREQKGPFRDCIDDILPDEPNFDHTAALIANLDLVITVDTAVAHLAGAMGKPVWLMNTAEPGSWHWMAERPGSPWNERSPWYPSVKIYRQQTVGEWGELVERVAADLRTFSRGE